MDNYNTLFNGSLLRDFELALRTGDTALFTDTLQKYLLQSASTFDTTNENFYHGTVFGMLAILSDRYYISSNRESGEGRFDIQLEPKDKSQLGYIIEFKAGKTFQIPNLLILRQVRYNRSKAKNILPTWNIMVSKNWTFWDCIQWQTCCS